LPQLEKKEIYMPSEEDVRRIMAKAKGTPYEVPFVLAIFGLRRSEILAITGDCVDGNVLTVKSAIVQDDKGEWQRKTTKTVDSTRKLIIPDDIAAKIVENGYAFNMTPRLINAELQKYQKELDIPSFTLHKLRYFFASYMHHKGFTDSQVQEAGGWKTDRIMKQVYRHAMEMDKAKEAMCADIDSLLSEEDKGEK
jgi:integrase